MKAVIFDIEILKAIPPKNPSERLAHIEYCEGWRDFAGMGIACIGAYDYVEDRYRVFTEGNFLEFADLIARRELVVGFNSIAFDNQVLAAAGFSPGIMEALEGIEFKSYDLLREIWAADGLGPEFNRATHGGYGLEDCCAANFDLRKSGNGALAPIAWQEGRYGEVIDYCLNDVLLTKRLFDEVLAGRILRNPKAGRKPQLELRAPRLPAKLEG